MWVKICGVTNETTAEAIAALRPDAIGLNFYAPSPRFVAPEIAAKIVAALPADVEPVALFVNSTADDIRRICRQCGIETVQLHGDEPASLLAELAEFRLLRAFRIGEDGVASIRDELSRFSAAGVTIDGCFVEARVPGAYGGTGTRGPWEMLRDWPEDWPPLILAGGLNPENVAEGIACTRPWGVDVASGVESRPGVKDLDRVRAFIENARNAS